MLSKIEGQKPHNLHLWTKWLKHGKLFIHRKYHKVVLLTPNELVETRWGDYSLVIATLNLLRATEKFNGEFNCICLVSDDTIPIKAFVNSLLQDMSVAQLSFSSDSQSQQQLKIMQEMLDWAKTKNLDNWWQEKRLPRPHSQWMILSMEAVRYLLENYDEIVLAAQAYDKLVTQYNNHVLQEILGEIEEEAILSEVGDPTRLQTLLSKEESLTQEDVEGLNISLRAVQYYKFKERTSKHNHFAPDELVIGWFLEQQFKDRIHDAIVMTEELDPEHPEHADSKSFHWFSSFQDYSPSFFRIHRCRCTKLKIISHPI